MLCACGREAKARCTRCASCMRARHGAKRLGRPTPEYQVWGSMRQRCSNPNASHYHRYGGRGIRVCDRWQVFENFLADMGPRPSPKHSIDRIDNDGDYEPGNCRWATHSQQVANRIMPSRRLLTFRGKTQPVKAWAAEMGLPYSTLKDRLSKGWDVARAISEPRFASSIIRPSRAALCGVGGS